MPLEFLVEEEGKDKEGLTEVLLFSKWCRLRNETIDLSVKTSCFINSKFFGLNLFPYRVM